eukprot:6199557-Pleurochrysis_carterae.AAC.1
MRRRTCGAKPSIFTGVESDFARGMASHAADCVACGLHNCTRVRRGSRVEGEEERQERGRYVRAHRGGDARGDRARDRARSCQTARFGRLFYRAAGASAEIATWEPRACVRSVELLTVRLAEGVGPKNTHARRKREKKGAEKRRTGGRSIGKENAKSSGKKGKDDLNIHAERLPKDEQYKKSVAESTHASLLISSFHSEDEMYVSTLAML